MPPIVPQPQPPAVEEELEVNSRDLPDARLTLDSLVQMIRNFTRDYPELNRLISGVESSNRQIVWAIFDTLDDFNTTPPFTHFVISNFPSRYVFVRGAVISLLQSIGLLQTRNQLSFTDGGIQVGINDKTPFIQQWLQLFMNSYEHKKERIKVAYNIESAWEGGINSEYRFVNNFYGEW